MMLYFFDTKIQLFPLFPLRPAIVDSPTLSLSPAPHLSLGDNPGDNPRSKSKEGPTSYALLQPSGDKTEDSSRISRGIRRCTGAYIVYSAHTDP